MITAQSQPDYDNWGWDTHWTCEDWLQWHRELVKVFGLAQANYKFITAFHQASFGASSYDCRTFNSAFRDYARQNGFLNGLYEGIGSVMQPVGTVIDIGGNVLETAQSASDIIKKIIPLMILIAVIIGFIFISKKAQIL